MTASDYNHAKRICSDYERKHLGEYHDLQLKSNTLLADLFENFRNMYVRIFELDPAIFFLA